MTGKFMMRPAVLNGVFALLWCRFAYVYARAFFQNPAFVTALFFALETSIVVAYCIRRPALVQSHRWRDCVPAFGAIALGMQFRPSWPTRDVPLGYVLEVAGICVTLLGMLSLGRSFALLPANRGLKTGGLYADIRHPVYVGYMLIYTGYAVLNPSGRNIVVLLGCVGLLCWRAANEERVLAQDPAWTAYAKRVRWRLVPRVF